MRDQEGTLCGTGSKPEYQHMHWLFVDILNTIPRVKLKEEVKMRLQHLTGKQQNQTPNYG